MTKFEIVDNFIKNYKISINHLYKNYIKNITQQEFVDELKKYLLSLDLSYKENLYVDLFYISNEFSKSKFIPNIKKYICPACKFLGENSILQEGNSLVCKSCKEKINLCQDKKYINLYKIFSSHSKNGFKCKECNRFLPAINTNNIICPYLDCSFIGPIDSLKKMAHPILQEEINISCNKENKIKNELYDKINNILINQSNNLSFSSTSFTSHHKLLIFKSFKKLLDLYPEKMINYLCNNSRSGGFQHKIFQTYISMLEDSFPILIRKNKKFIRISNLLDNNLCLFDGISIFTGVVNNNIITNNTKEYYIGGRKASYAKPFYIGKILNIIDKSNNQSLINNIEEYSFNKIKMKNVIPGTIVEVTHLRIPPHYQMGGMVYVNRIRKSIVEEIKNVKI